MFRRWAARSQRGLQPIVKVADTCEKHVTVSDTTIVKPGAAVAVRGIAFGGDSGVSQVELSDDGGQSWQKTVLGRDEGTYSFRLWSTQITAPQSGTLTLHARCTNTKGEVQPAEPNWNGGGFMRNVIETVQLKVA